MAFIQEKVINVVTDASGDVTEYSEAVSGIILDAYYVKDGSNPFADGVDITITTERYGVAIVAATNQNTSAHWTPRQIAHLNTSVATVTGAQEPIPVSTDRIKVVVAQGGNAKNGRIVIQVG